jgi:ParB-like chromosome segregation protein Spo0J
VIIAGHARALAARRLNLERVPVIVLGHLSEECQAGAASQVHLGRRTTQVRLTLRQMIGE